MTKVYPNTSKRSFVFGSLPLRLLPASLNVCSNQQVEAIVYAARCSLQVLQEQLDGLGESSNLRIYPDRT